MANDRPRLSGNGTARKAEASFRTPKLLLGNPSAVSIMILAGDQLLWNTRVGAVPQEAADRSSNLCCT
jgi:hypothetical protein